METLLNLTDIDVDDLAALVVKDQPICRIQRSSRTAAVLRDNQVILSHDTAGRPLLAVLSPAA